jgi:FkbM family methyltransferase
MKKIKIGIIDIIGLPYDGTTIVKKGLGGSESAVISMSKELVKLDFSVTVINSVGQDNTQPGTYQGVEYCNIETLSSTDYDFDIVISQRNVIPFTPEHLYDQVRQPAPRDHPYKLFDQLKRPNQLKIVWLHDTFCWGDHLLENLVISGHVNELFTLSDWHTAYTTHSTHGPRRNVEVLKRHIFQTRNGINRWVDWVDIKDKDPNLFVYNASVTKGMIPLLDHIWPRLKTQLPQARLKIIGGYYQYPNEPINDQGRQLLAFQEKFRNDQSVEFTGIITQAEIAKILTKATYMIYPGAFPETHGISTLEAINHNVPLLTCRFGALEETATEIASYFINYAIEPNSLFPAINSSQQIDLFVDMVLKAVHDPYRLQQKQYACNAVKDISTWDTVALQWKQHFYSKLHFDLTQEEQRQVEWINYRVHKVFNRRFTNPEEIVVPKKTTPFAKIYVDRVNLAIIDISGMSYDGSTLDRRGLGGSESAVILAARELSKIGFSVTVFNACTEDDSNPGIYDNVIYRPITDIEHDECNFDVVISSRNTMPFITEPFYGLQINTVRRYHYDMFKRLREKAKFKVFWMHDTFSWGDEIIEDLVLSGAVDEIWCLSDFHAYYVMHCDHGKKRNYEVLRKHMWVTRNGAVPYFDSVDIDKKDPNLFIFNANMSKGLRTLLHDIWPKVKLRIPKSKLKVVGGFYKLGSAFGNANSQETEFHKIVGNSVNDPSIEFTGVISQKQVSEICKLASYFIYPAELPETYGISCLESLYGNTPLLTCRFGALEETATDISYFIDYAVTPNGLYPNIDPVAQANKFVDMVVDAYNNPQEHRLRMESCDQVKDLAGWDTTALQWKQHLYSKLGKYLPRDEFQSIEYLTKKYHKIFNRRLSNLEQWTAPKLFEEKRIIVVSPFYNSINYIEKCINSVATQDYDNYEHWLIDDLSTDGTYEKAAEFIKSLPNTIQEKFHLVRNSENIGAVANQVLTMSKIKDLKDDDIIILLDGDDSLVNRNDIFTYYNHLHEHADFTYGSCWSLADNIPLIAQPYPPQIKQNKDYKNYQFNWGMPYTHLRTFKAGIFKDIPHSHFKNNQGRWFRAGGDNSVFYSVLERTDPEKIYVVSDIVYEYNDINPLNDYKVNAQEQTKNAREITGIGVSQQHKKHSTMNKKILIAIPTNKNIEVQTFKSIYDLEVPHGYETEFQYFWGYSVSQVRNLIADWIINGPYDYLFSVDSDIAFPPDTLTRLLNHDKDMVSGLYIQRIPGTHTVEVMRYNGHGGVSHVPYEDIGGQGLVPIDSCGFGCVLIKKHVFQSMPYPHFVYHEALNHANTISEDVYFCKNAREKGFQIWADTDILCDHIGSWTFRIDQSRIADKKTPATANVLSNEKLRDLSTNLSLSISHQLYLKNMKESMHIEPKVIYDIGAGVLHWTKVAKEIWPDTNIYAFEAMDESEFLFQEINIPYHIGLLSDEDGKELEFYQNLDYPTGNSYYRENVEFSPMAEQIFTDSHKIRKTSVTLDTVVNKRKFPKPDLIKMDVQGSELDILRGAQETLKTCQHLILELQLVQYNIGAPLRGEVIEFLEKLGFYLLTPLFSDNGPDGDYHFVRKEIYEQSR